MLAPFHHQGVELLVYFGVFGQGAFEMLPEGFVVVLCFYSERFHETFGVGIYHEVKASAGVEEDRIRGFETDSFHLQEFFTCRPFPEVIEAPVGQDEFCEGFQAFGLLFVIT